MADSPYKDGLAVLDYLLDGRALPDHLARSRAGVILPKHRTAKETAAEEAREFNKRVMEEATAKMSKAPLIAVCHNHKCACGNIWQSFGFYARSATQRIQGQGTATFMKRLDYNPAPEQPASVEWQDREEPVCVQCYGGPSVPPTPDARGRIGGVSSLSELVRLNTTINTERRNA